MKESPLFWPVRLQGRTLFVLDETLLPSRQRIIEVKEAKQAVNVIRRMKTRAFGQVLVVLYTFLSECRKHDLTDKALLSRLKKLADMLNRSRPTFPFAEVTGMVNGWAREAYTSGKALRPVLEVRIKGFLSGIRKQREGRIGKIASAIRTGDVILTHCNVSGELAMAAALCRAQKKKVKYFATETRPYFQGAKLTAWELKEMGADVTLIADNAVGSLLQDRIITKVIVGSDRSCANGDIANKVGTYQIACLAREFGIPFYALVQPSVRIKSGKSIPIEIRPADELLKYKGRRLFPKAAKGFYPGFDVIPREFITKRMTIDAR